MKHFSPILNDTYEPITAKTIKEGQRFIPLSFEGEAILTLGRAKLFEEAGANLIVNCSPFGCMPGRITSYIFQRFPDFCKIPVVNLFFDGTGDIASQVSIYLKSITQSHTLHDNKYMAVFKTKTPKHKEAGIIESVYKDKDQYRSVDINR
ncbi:MAG TPA: hypothetical protein ENN05_08230 [Deltaproteobacteria bacterium]|nr:hypothetical protein [Deltaproteobacteria bacterium]